MSTMRVDATLGFRHRCEILGDERTLRDDYARCRCRVRPTADTGPEQITDTITNQSFRVLDTGVLRRRARRHYVRHGDSLLTNALSKVLDVLLDQDFCRVWLDERNHSRMSPRGL